MWHAGFDQQNLQYGFPAALPKRKYCWGEEIMILGALPPLFNHSYTTSKLNWYYLDRVIKNVYIKKIRSMSFQTTPGCEDKRKDLQGGHKSHK